MAVIEPSTAMPPTTMANPSEAEATINPFLPEIISFKYFVIREVINRDNQSYPRTCICISFLLFWFGFETGSHRIAMADLELIETHLPLPLRVGIKGVLYPL